MVEKSNPSVNRPIEAFKTAGAIAYGGSGKGFISRANSPTDLSVQDNEINEDNLNAFDQTSNPDSIQVTIDGGEAFIFGSWVAKDTNTTVILEASENNQTIYVGWNKGGSNDVIIGTSSEFDNSSGNADKKLPLFTYDTDSSGVVNYSDKRRLGRYISSEVVKALKSLSIPVYSNTLNASNVEGEIIYIDGSDTQKEGLYIFNGNEYVRPGKTNEELQDTINSFISTEYGIEKVYLDQSNSLVLKHSNTSDQNDVSLPSGHVISELVFDNFGHVESVETKSLDNRYINNSGDDMVGDFGIISSQIFKESNSPNIEVENDGNGLIYTNNSTGENIQRIDADGNLKIKGTITENTSL